MASRAALEPLSMPAFRRLALAQTVNELGDWLGIIALAILVFDRTGSALATTALFLGTRFVPAFVAPGLVARVEVIDPRFSLGGIYGLEAATFIGLAVLTGGRFSLATVIVLAALDGSLALAGRSLTRAAAAAVLKPVGRLRAGNAILNIGFTAAAAVGPAAAGLIVGGLGVRAALLLDAGSFLLVALTLTTARLPHPRVETRSWRRRMREGFAYVAASSTLRRLLGAQAAAFVFFAAVIPIEVIYAKQTLSGGDAGYGALLASWGAGMLAGSLLFAAARRASLRTLLLASTLTVGLAYLGLAAAQTLAVACVVSALGGAGNGVQWVSLLSAIQSMTAEHYQARVVALLESIGAAMPGLGYVLGGSITALVSTRGTFLAAGAGVVAVVLIAIPLLAGQSWSAHPASPPGST